MKCNMAQWLACLSRNWLLNVWPEFEPESGQKGLLPKRSGQERPTKITPILCGLGVERISDVCFQWGDNYNVPLLVTGLWCFTFSFVRRREIRYVCLLVCPYCWNVHVIIVLQMYIHHLSCSCIPMYYIDVAVSSSTTTPI